MYFAEETVQPPCKGGKPGPTERNANAYEDQACVKTSVLFASCWVLGQKEQGKGQ